MSTVLGAQRHAYRNMDRVVESNHAGVIGDVAEVRSWVDACEGQGLASCDFSYAGPLIENLLPGNVEYWTVGFDWDWGTMSTESNKLHNLC